MSKAFDKISKGLEEAIAYAEGKTEGAIVTEYSPLDIKAIRQKSGLSQAKFAKEYGFPVDTYKKWEQGQRKPNRTAMVLLKVLDKRPDAVEEALAVV